MLERIRSFLKALAPDPGELRRNWKDYAQIVFGAVALRFAFPPHDMWPTAWIALALLFASLRGQTGKPAFYRGWLFGFCYFYAICAFLNTLVVYKAVVLLGVVLLALASGLYTGAFALGAASLARRRPRLSFLLIPAWWVGLEFLRSSGELGFPFGTLAHSQWSLVGLIQICSITGVGGLSFLIVLVNVALAHALSRAPAERRAKRSPLAKATYWRAAPLIGSLVVVGLIAFSGRWIAPPPAPADAAEARLLLVQPNVPQIEKWNSYLAPDVESAYAIWDRMALKTIGLTRRAGPGGDLIVWPETAIPDPYFNVNPHYTAPIETLVDRWGVPLFLGANRVELDPKTETVEAEYVSAYLVAPGEKVEAARVYDKNHLVPFGEDFSYFRYLPFVTALGLDLGAFDRGSTVTVFDLPLRGEATSRVVGRTRFSSVICFESTMPYLFRRGALAGAEFFVVVTNDAWYGLSSGAAQHQIQSVFRAVETRRWVARCANTGISCFIAPDGRVVSKTKLGRPATLEGKVRARRDKTLYVRFGHWFDWLCLALSAAFLIPWQRMKHACFRKSHERVF